MRDQGPIECIKPLKTLDAPGFAVREAVYCAATTLAAELDRWAGLCLTLEGGYQIERGRTRLNCGPATLVFQAPGEIPARWLRQCPAPVAITAQAQPSGRTLRVADPAAG